MRELLDRRAGVESVRRWFPRLTIQWPVEVRAGADGSSRYRLGMLASQRSDSWPEYFRLDLATCETALLSPADRIRAAAAVTGFVQCLHSCDLVCGRFTADRFRLAGLATGLEVMALFDATCRPAGWFWGGAGRRYDFETDRVGLRAALRRLLATHDGKVVASMAGHLPAGGTPLLQRLLAEETEHSAPRPEEWLVTLGSPIPETEL